MTDPTNDPPQPTAGPSRIQPLQNPRFRHISRSAAKRESVQLLGSIKDLQAHFSQALSVEHKAGSGAGVKGLGTLGEEQDEDEGEVKRRVSKPRLAERRPWKEVQLPRVDVEEAKTELKGLLDKVKELWAVSETSNGIIERGGGEGMTRSPTVATLAHTSSTPIDTRDILITTARSIRRVRELGLTLISQPGRKVSGSSGIPRSSNARPSISTASRPAQRVPSYGNTQERKSSLSVIGEGGGVSANTDPDQLADLRKAALEVLAGLRSLEERLRVHHARPATTTVEPSDSLIIPSSTSSSRPQSSQSNLLSEPDPYLTDTPSPSAAEEEEFNLNLLAADSDLHEHLETWEERIVIENRSYRCTEGDEGVREREAVKWWCGVVDGLFLHEKEPGAESGRKWAEGNWEGRELERVHEYISTHLPLELDLQVPSTAQSDFGPAFLRRLSDGYLLLTALNTALHQSPKPWGFVASGDIYDTLQGVDEEGGDWTFRRVGNLTAWAAAIKHRFNLPLILPSQTSIPLTYLQSQPLPSIRSSRSEPRPDGRPIAQPLPQGPAQVAPSVLKRRDKEEQGAIVFEPLVIAKRAEGWEGMLEAVLKAWVEAAVVEVNVEEERRNARKDKEQGASERGGWL